jgi:uncharacterized protein (TIGR03790 family)
MRFRSAAVLAALVTATAMTTATSTVATAQDLTSASLGVVYDLDDANSVSIARLYVAKRGIPPENLLGVHVGHTDVMSPDAFASLRREVLDGLSTAVQSLAIVWSQPYAVGCMSITSAMAAGYRADFCTSQCAATPKNPLFDVLSWLPADTVGWWPAMLLPTDDTALARALIERGLEADGTRPPGTVYLVHTPDSHRNVRAASYGDARAVLDPRVRVVELWTPIERSVADAIGYFTGAARVAELSQIHFRPGAVADHLTSFGGILDGRGQMSVIDWIRQGATASFGTVSEPCNIPGKFPDIAVLMRHYLAGDTALEAYWKSVATPGQGLFVGEPLSRPYGKP